MASWPSYSIPALKYTSNQTIGLFASTAWILPTGLSWTTCRVSWVAWHIGKTKNGPGTTDVCLLQNKYISLTSHIEFRTQVGLLGYPIYIYTSIYSTCLILVCPMTCSKVWLRNAGSPGSEAEQSYRKALSCIWALYRQRSVAWWIIMHGILGAPTGRTMKDLSRRPNRLVYLSFTS